MPGVLGGIAARWHPASRSLCGHHPLRLGAREPRRIKHSARLTFHLKAPGLRLHTDVIKLQTLQPRLYPPTPTLPRRSSLGAAHPRQEVKNLFSNNEAGCRRVTRNFPPSPLTPRPGRAHICIGSIRHRRLLTRDGCCSLLAFLFLLFYPSYVK